MYLTKQQLENFVKKVGQPEASILFQDFFKLYRKKLGSYDVASIYDVDYFDKLNKHPEKLLIDEKYKVHIYAYYSYEYITNKKKHASILDIGCGNGDFALALAFQGYDCVGVDFDEASIKTAQLRAKINNLSVNFICSDVVDVSHDFTVDYVVLNDVSEHLSDSELEKVLYKAYELLKPNGELLIHTPNGFALCNETDICLLQRILKFYFKIAQNYKGFERSIEQMFYDQVHINIKSYPQLKKILRDCGFSSKVIYDSHVILFNKLGKLNNIFNKIMSSNMLVVAKKLS